MQTDYLILGSGLSALSFGALMAQAKKKVIILEAHELPGGFGHTFQAGPYKFNAQFHYVWDCGEGDPVHRFLKKLKLDKKVTFERFDPTGFDHMHIPGHSLKIPGDYDLLIERLGEMFPRYAKRITHFLRDVKKVADQAQYFSKPIRLSMIRHLHKGPFLLKFYGKTLQEVFNSYGLPLEAQSLLASQWPDFLLPPQELSFYCWVVLFDGYMRGAYYPTKHFEYVIDSLVKVIRSNGGEIRYNEQVTRFILEKDRVKGVITESVDNAQNKQEYNAKNIVCNFDPKKAAQMIGLQKFSPLVRSRLNYDYSPSNFMGYCAVKNIDLKDYGFGKWNLFHSCHQDINEAFYKMYREGDYSKPSFAMTTPSLMTQERGDCPPDHQIVEFVTVAEFDRFKKLKFKNGRSYQEKKTAILNSIIDIVEQQYVPNFRQHMVFQMTGSPTTNERYCWVPEGNSYGSNMTPKNVGINRLDSHTSLKNFYFCGASSGFAGFAKTIWTGSSLYEQLSGDKVPINN